MSKAWALHKRVRSRTGLRAVVRPCRGDTCSYIYGIGTKIAIIGSLTHENISIKRAGAKFRCQSPAGPILAHKIPLPKSSPISPPATDFVVTFGYLGRFLDGETGFLPELRDEAVIRRRRGAGVAGAIRRPARGCRGRSN